MTAPSRCAKMIVPFRSRARVEQEMNRRLNQHSKLRAMRIEGLEQRALLAVSPIITEFVADNDDSLTDGKGASSDWIEIFNPGSESLNLSGWHLTDDPSNLQLWTFPSVDLAAGAYLVVFASGDDGVDSAGNLHTNFRINANGDFLGLVQPDGTTTVSQWPADGEEFPKQFEDLSYGFTAYNRTLLESSSSVDVLIPSAADATRLGKNWTGADEVSFEAAGGLDGWRSGVTGVGHEPLDPLTPYQALVQSEPSLLSHYTFDADDRSSKGIHDVAGSITQHGTFKCLSRFDDLKCADTFVEGVRGQGQSLSLHGGGFVDLGAVPEFIFADESGTIEAWLRPTDELGSWFGTRSEIARGPGPATRLALNYNGHFSGFGTSGRRGDGGSFRASASLPEDQWLHVVLVFSEGNARFYVNAQSIPDDQVQGWQRLGDINSNLTSQIGIAAFPKFDSAFRGQIDELAIYEDPLSEAMIDAHFRQLRDDLKLSLTTDVASEMRDLHASAFLRMPFEVDDVESISRLQLNIRSSDGFVAYLNGVEVARNNVPENVDVGDTATSRNSLENFDSFNISQALPALRNGTNLLAVHGLNQATDDDFFFIQPELVATVEESEVRFFAQPTPGQPNIYPGVLDVVRDVEISGAHGFYDRELDVVLTAPTTGSTLVYTTNGSLPTLENGVVVEPASANERAIATLHISKTTSLRVAAFKEGWQTSNVRTQTYVLLRDNADVQALFEPLPEFVDTGTNPVFILNDAVFNDPKYNDRLIESLKLMPTISLTVDPDEFLGEEGIYDKNFRLSGRQSERAVSVEYFTADPNEDGFQINAGMRISGNLARNFSKKPLRLFFREEYGEGRLRFPLFEGSPVTSFNQLVLRSGGVDAFSGSTDEKSMIREPLQFTANLEMGQPTPRVKYSHIFINGRYWGIYYATERPEEDFAADYLGGDADNWDIMNMPSASMPPVVKSGTKTAWDHVIDIAEAGLEDPERYGQIKELVEIDNFIDHLIVKMFYGTGDWGGSKNYFMGRHPEANKFYFFNWDSDFSAGNPGKSNGGNLTGIDRDDSPARLYTQLRANPEFRIRFADRIHRHLFNDGALTEARNTQRLEEIRELIAEPMIMETIRWGTSEETPEVWQSEVDWIRDVFLAQRWDLQMQQFRDAQLYPSISAAKFSIDGQHQHGGEVSNEALLTIDSDQGTVYYTLDGSDPRLPGGALNPQARQFDPISPISLIDSSLIRARVLDDTTWSAITEAQFAVAVANPEHSLRISEIHYHPSEPTVAEREAGYTDADDFEFIELVNVSAQTLDLSSFRFERQELNGTDEGIAFNFVESQFSSLEPGDRVVVVENAMAFANRYGDGVPVAGQWLGGLSNAGERLKLVTGDQTVHDFEYDDAWHPTTDGGGFSLTIVDPAAALTRWSVADGWRPSVPLGGTPGRGYERGDLDADGQLGTSDIDYLYDQIHAQSDDPALDLTDDGVIDQADVDELVHNLLNTVYGDVNLDGLFDERDLVSIFEAGRYEDGVPDNTTYAQGDWDGDGDFTSEDLVFVFQLGVYTPSLGQATPILSEIVALNRDSLRDGEGNDPDWIEIFNPGGKAISLEGWYLTDDPDERTKWRFPAHSIPAGSFSVVFASGEDRPDIAGNLHTNFQLASGGEYVALVRPNGLTIVSEVGSPQADYPQQFADVSYGRSFVTLPLVDGTTSAHVIVPSAETDAQWESTWQGGDDPAFQAAGGLDGWQRVSASVGHQPDDRLSKYRRQVLMEPSLLSYYTFDSDSDRANGIQDSAGSITQHGTLKCLTRFDDADCDLPFEVGVDGRQKALSLHGGGFIQLGRVPEFEFSDGMGTIEAWLLPSPQSGTWFGTATELARGPGKAKVFSLGVGDDYRGLSKDVPRDFENGESEVLATADLPIETWFHLAVVFHGSQTQFYIDGMPVEAEAIVGFDGFGETNSNVTSQIGISAFPKFDTAFRGKIDELAIYSDPLDDNTILKHFQAARVSIDLNIESNLNSVAEKSASAYVRVPFEVDNEADLVGMTLRMQVADGFAAYLNGVLVASHNVPDDLNANSTATDRHAIDDVIEINLSEYLPVIRDGKNVLAIHGLNFDKFDDFFLVAPELVAWTLDAEPLVFFPETSPGAANSASVNDIVRPVEFDRLHGIYDQSMDVTLSTSTAGATLVYTIDGSVPTIANGIIINAVNDNTPPSVTLPIDQTTTIRTVAFKENWQSSNVNTSTYILLRDNSDVLALGTPIPGAVTLNQFGFELTETLVNDPAYRDDMISSLKAIPTLSIVGESSDIFGPDGIYVNAEDRGRRAERPVSVEYFGASVGEGFQLNAGLRLFGNVARRSSKIPLRLVFRREYGADKLRYPFFNDSPVEEFDTLMLRSGGHVLGPKTTHLRDTFNHVTQREMGHLSPYTGYVHVYINGRYWGMYLPKERPDSDFLSEHMGGDVDEWDAFKNSNASGPPDVVSGNRDRWDELMEIIEGGVDSVEAFGQVEQHVDIDNYIDYVMLRIFGGDVDWGDTKNYYLGGNRESGRFQFYLWDSELSLGLVLRDIVTDVKAFPSNVPRTPGRLFWKLQDHTEYRLRFADRIQHHFFNNGALTPEQNIERWNRLADQVELPFLAESARWGAAPGSPQLIMSPAIWREQVDWVINDFFPVRTAIVLEQFQSIGLYPSIEAPAFLIDDRPQHGGSVNIGAALTAVAKTDLDVYFTTDGSDPRLPGGDINPSAQKLTAESSFTVNANTVVKARSFRNGIWSALSRAEYEVV